MGIQTDIETLSIEALEFYAKEHSLSSGETFELFQKHRVFEKILLQYEYLHQPDFSETTRCVEEIIAEQAPELVLSHVTNIAFDTIVLKKSRNRRDFGCGF